jgi:hypothetical protein
MPKYRVKEKSFINNVLHEAGAEIEFNGIPGKNLEPLDGEARKAAGKLPDANKDAAVRMKDAAAGADLGDPDYKPGIAQATAPAAVAAA